MNQTATARRTGAKKKAPAKAGKRAKAKARYKAKTRRKAKGKHEHHAHKNRAAHVRESTGKEPMFVVRSSPIHGRGVYATRRIRKGTRVSEYIGERISHDEADERYAAKPQDGHTFLFVVNDEICIDATNEGNDSRYITHSCDPNCESDIEDDRVFVDAIRTIQPGEELVYDYSLTWESADDPEELKLYDCLCGAKDCRGTMLAPDPVDLEEKKKDKKKKDKKDKKKKKRDKDKKNRKDKKDKKNKKGGKDKKDKKDKKKRK